MELFRLDDPDVMHLLKIMLKANGRCGYTHDGSKMLLQIGTKGVMDSVEAGA
jgi:hypothetical protein